MARVVEPEPLSRKERMGCVLGVWQCFLASTGHTGALIAKKAWRRWSYRCSARRHRRFRRRRREPAEDLRRALEEAHNIRPGFSVFGLWSLGGTAKPVLREGDAFLSFRDLRPGRGVPRILVLEAK